MINDTQNNTIIIRYYFFLFFFYQSSAMSPHGSMGFQAPGFSVMSSASLQQPSNAMTQQMGQQPSVAGRFTV